MRALSMNEINHVSGAEGELLLASLFIGTVVTAGLIAGANQPYYYNYPYSYGYSVPSYGYGYYYDPYAYPSSSTVIIYDDYYYPSYDVIVW